MMDTQSKLDILSRDAQYDLSCACGTKNPLEHRKRNTEGTGWLYPATTASGGPGIMLKTLLGNRCSNDCKYCPLRQNQDFRPIALSAYEMASFFYDFQLKRQLIGLFLSSAVLGTADQTMDMLVSTAEILRKHFRYKGYIHLKVIPGASRASIDAALRYASAVSLNIETPGANHFAHLTERKDFQKDILDPLLYIAKQTGRGAKYGRVHTSSQFIVGASDEKDTEILRYTSRMYSDLHMGRLYFSAYQRGLGDPGIPGEQVLVESVPNPQLTLFDLGTDLSDPSSLMREHRLYQADWLLRQYGFTYDELPFETGGNLSLTQDPKLVWAQRHPEVFPLSIKRASKADLLRVPGLGPVYVSRIIRERRDTPIPTLESLRLPPNILQKARQYLQI